MKEVDENSKIINETIPQVIADSNLYTKEFKKRMKLNGIFSEFENKASKQLNFYIDESNRRYNKSKFGINLSSSISATRNKCVNESIKILKDKFYNNNIIDEERSKMPFKNEKLYNNVLNKIKIIKNPELKNKELNLENLKEEDITIDNYMIIDKKLDEYLKRYKSFNYNSNNNLPLYNRNSNISNLLEKKKLSRDRTIIDDVIKNENNSIFSTFNNYKINLNKLKKKYDNEKKIKNKEPTLNLHKKININFPKLKLLNYVNYELAPKDGEEDIGIKKPDIYKLIPFSKYAKYCYGIKQQSISLNNSQNYKGRKYNRLPYITEPNIPDNKHYYKNFKSTISVVHDTAIKELFADKNYDKKRDDTENIFGMENIPKLQIYDYIAHKNATSVIDEKKAKDDIICKKQNYKKLNLKQRRNYDILSNLKMINDIEKDLYYNSNIKTEESQ